MAIFEISTTATAAAVVVAKTAKYGNLIPISKADYDALKDSIAKDGLHYPIIVNQHGDVLDGHNRLKICQELHHEFYDVKDPKAHTVEICPACHYRNHKDALINGRRRQQA